MRWQLLEEAVLQKDRLMGDKRGPSAHHAVEECVIAVRHACSGIPLVDGQANPDPND
jgi:hypothetical protein